MHAAHGWLNDDEENQRRLRGSTTLPLSTQAFAQAAWGLLTHKEHKRELHA